MTTAPSSTSFERSVRREPAHRAACLRVRWSVAPTALGRTGRSPLTVELELRQGGPARVTVNGEAFQPAADWASTWDDTLTIRRMGTGHGRGLMIVQASPLAVVVFSADDAQHPLHVACDLPEALGLRGGRYELTGGGLSF